MGEEEGRLGLPGLPGLSHAWRHISGGPQGWTDQLPPPPATRKFGDLRPEPFPNSPASKFAKVRPSLWGPCLQKYRNLESVQPGVSTNPHGKQQAFWRGRVLLIFVSISKLGQDYFPFLLSTFSSGPSPRLPILL